MPLLGARFLFVAPRSADRGFEAVKVERLPERLRLHHVGIEPRAASERINAVRQTLMIGMND